MKGDAGTRTCTYHIRPALFVAAQPRTDSQILLYRMPSTQDMRSLPTSEERACQLTFTVYQNYNLKLF